MRFVVFADSGCNLPQRKLQELGIEVVPFAYELDGELIVCPKYPDGFDGPFPSQIRCENLKYTKYSCIFATNL